MPKSYTGLHRGLQLIAKPNEVQRIFADEDLQQMDDDFNWNFDGPMSDSQIRHETFGSA